MKKLFTYISLLLFILIANQTKASHLTGCDISYTCTSSPGIYKVTMKVYRDCSGIPLCANCGNGMAIPNGNVTGCTTASSGFPLANTITGASSSCNGVSYGSFTLTAISASSGYDIITTCNTVKTTCTNCQTRTAGTFSPGIEVYTYEGNVDLSLIPTSCCKIILGAGTCCRNFSLSTMVAGNFQAVCEINRCQTTCNSAPVFTNDAIALVCTGVDFVYNLGASDPDGDSLSYAFGTSLQGITSSVSYVSPYNAAYPFPYLGAPNANAAYPAGLRIDPITGDVMFRPLGVFLSQLVIEVIQWRLLGGVRVNIGITRRDLQLQVQLCLPNRAPLIKVYRNGVINTTSNSFSIPALQQFCLDIIAEDITDTSTITTDTTDLSWNNPGVNIPAMANATFVRNYILAQRGISGPKADSFKFCWTPPISAIRAEPYLFTANGFDRFCPLKAFVIRGISIKVDTIKFLNITSALKTNFCTSQTSNTTINYNVNNFNLSIGNIFTVQLSDSLGSFNTFTTIGTKTDTLKTDTINITVPAGLSANGTYKLRVKNSSDTSVLGTPFSINILPSFVKPTITASKDSFCKASGKAILSVLPTNSTYSFSWLFNNALLTGATNDSILTDTTAAIKAIVSNGGCLDTSFAKILTINNATNVNFTINQLNQCLRSNNFIFTNNSLPNNGTLTYLWKFGNGDTSTLRNPTKVYSNAGTYVTKMIVNTNTNCVDSFQTSVIINPSPTANFSIADSIKCLTGNSFNFINSSAGATSYNWSFGDNTNSTLTNPNKTYTSAGNYNVKLISTVSGCTDSITKSVTVLTNATNVNYSINQINQCLRNNNYIFTNNSLPNNGTLTYLWKFGDGDTSTLRNPSKIYTNTGTYVAKMIVTANNKCKDSFQSNIIVNLNPIADFSNLDSIKCLTGNSFSFLNKSFGATSFIWSFGDNTTSIFTSTNKTYNIAGTFIVKLIASSNSCADSTTKTVTVLANATNVNFTINQASQCLLGNNFIFTNNTTPNNSNLTYLWKFGNNVTSTQISPSINYSNTGNYLVTLIINSNINCADSISKNVSVNAKTTIGNILGNLNPNSLSTTYNYSVLNQNNVTYNWTVTNATIQSGQNTNKVSVKYNSNGNAKVVAQITNTNNCTDTVSVGVSVNAVGVNDLSLANDLKVFPNPTKALLTITNKSNLGGKKYTISNLLGQTLLIGKLNQDETIINIELLGNGVYLLSIDGSNKQAIKIVKY